MRKPTTLIWCLHKSGSVFVTQQIRALLRLGRTRLVEPTGGEEDWLDGEIAAKRKGHVFCPIRVPQQVTDLDAVTDLPKVLIYRDPRDVIVSYYYSTAFSHPVPEEDDQARAAFLSAREKAKRDGLEDYALHSGIIKLLLARYGYVINHLLLQPNMLIVPYETLVTDYEASMRRLIHWCGIGQGTPLLGRWLAKRVLSRGRASLDYRSDDPASHKRQIWPGDHKRKLGSATISELNRRLRPVMEPLGYPR